MAIKIYEKFAPRANPADGDYPYGSIKNESVPGAKDGTPLDAVWANDYAGTDAELFAQAGIVPNGQPDKLGASQRVEAMVALFGKNLAGVTAMKIAPDLVAGDIVNTGNTTWEIVSYITTMPLASGLYARPLNEINILDFGADNTGVVLCNDALNDAADVGPVYAPPGKYNISGFTRRIKPSNVNVGQERLVVYGDLTPMTALHQYMAATTIFEGDGNMFLDVVNYSFMNIGVRNKVDALGAPISPGYLFSMYGKGLEAGTWVNCYFGACLRHFDITAASGNPTGTDEYMIGPNFDKSTFSYAQEISRNFEGTTANYTETGKCYTSHCQVGLRLVSPGPGLSLSSSIFEYINDYAIDIVAYGFSANYSVSLDSTFFESCGGGLGVIPGVPSTGEKAKAIPSVRISTQSSGGATVKFSHKSCFVTYTGANPPSAWFEIPVGTTTVDMFHHAFLNGSPSVPQVYTSNIASYANPFSADTNSLMQFDGNGIRLVGSKLHIGGVGEPNGTLQLTSPSGSITGWFYNSGSNVDFRTAATGVAGQFGQDAVNGFYIAVSAGDKDMTVKNGNIKAVKAGKGFTVTSPDGLITKTITINNAGSIVLI